MPHVSHDPTSRLRNAIVPFIGVEPSAGFQKQFEAMLAPMQEASGHCDRSRHCNDRIVNVWEGMLAVQYHRNEVERIIRETVDWVRVEFGESWSGREISISIKMSTLGFAYVAYLNAERSTLDYLAKAIAVCFGQQHSTITKLTKTIKQCEPSNLVGQVTSACDGLHHRFSHVLSEGNRTSERDQAQHYWPIKTPSLLVVLDAHGVGVRLQDGSIDDLSALNTRVSAGRQRLIDTVDQQIADLEDFAIQRLEIAVKAERQRAQTTG